MSVSLGGASRAVCFIGAPLCPIVSAVLVRGMRAEIPLFFVGQLFFRKLAAMDILTKQDNALRITLSEPDIWSAQGLKC